MAIMIYDPETGTVLGAESALLVDTDELESHITDSAVTQAIGRGDRIESLAEALLDEHPVAERIASAIGLPILKESDR